MPTPVEIYVNADRSLSGEWLPTESLLASFFGGSDSPLVFGQGSFVLFLSLPAPSTLGT